MIGSLVSWQQLSTYDVDPTHWGVIVDVEKDWEFNGVRVHWFGGLVQRAWWNPSDLTFVTCPVNEEGEGNVAEDIKRKT